MRYNGKWTDSPNTIDQIADVIKSIKNNPNSRRHIVTAWNPDEIEKMALPPCHCLFQFYVANGKLSCHLYQRSADWFLGVPFNIASYALLTHLMARECDLEVGEFIHSFGDLHLYANHREQAALQLLREPMKLPEISIMNNKSIFDLVYDDIYILGYESHPSIKAEISK
jgi:thymidylate synthase